MKNAKNYAAKNQTTLTDLIGAQLRHIPAQHTLEKAPIVRRLSGILPSEITIQDYKNHLDKKYSE